MSTSDNVLLHLGGHPDKCRASGMRHYFSMLPASSRLRVGKTLEIKPQSSLCLLKTLHLEEGQRQFTEPQL